jgi:hypothetical protein
VEEWLKVLLDGAAGAVLAASIAVVTVVIAVQRENRKDREQRQRELEQRKREAQTTLNVAVAQLARVARAYVVDVGRDRRPVNQTFQLVTTALEVIARATSSHPPTSRRWSPTSRTRRERGGDQASSPPHGATGTGQCGCCSR